MKWFASFTGFIGAMLIALHIDESKYAFFIFLSSSTIWIYAGIIMKEYSIVFLNIGFMTVDLIGIYRWILQ
jgi:hypothetical protein